VLSGPAEVSIHCQAVSFALSPVRQSNSSPVRQFTQCMGSRPRQDSLGRLGQNAYQVLLTHEIATAGRGRLSAGWNSLGRTGYGGQVSGQGDGVVV
jgi:hypothetical protein